MVAEIAARVPDVDTQYNGRTALWAAVFADRRKEARTLVTAGADPWRLMMAGWSPARLSLAGLRADVFVSPSGMPGLSETEAEVVTEHRRVLAAVAGVETEGLGLACAAGIDAAEAVRRLSATPDGRLRSRRFHGHLLLPHHDDDDKDTVMSINGVTDVPGGCVLTQPWGYGPSMSRVNELLSKGTVCYGLYGNPSSGNQGSVCRDAVMAGWDLEPGGGEVSADATADEVFEYLFRASLVWFRYRPPMTSLPETHSVPVVRVDFSDDAVWAQLKDEVLSPTVHGFGANVEFVEDRALAGLDEAALVGAMPNLYPSRYEHPVIFVVDSVTISLPEHPLLVIDLQEEDACDPFRSTPRQVQAIENNLSIANMDFDDFADAADGDGVFRGFE